MEDGLQVYEEFDLESIVLRRSDPDDCDQIINLVEIGKDDVYNRVYSYPKILKLIETAYLSISVLDQQGSVIAFASFEDYPHGMKGQYDDKHYNIWEEWFHQAFEVTEFASMNTLWLTYFISGGPIQHKEQQHAFKKVLQTVYTSLPDITGILFLMRGDADEEDTWYCFEPLKEYFEEVECKHKDVLKNVRGIHYNSKVYFSSRLLVLPFVEVRRALQEDHDDLAAVFNSQSETVTDTYGEYFIAELIAAQNDISKALVAQVHDKAVGLMGLTSDVDVKLLHQCFELESFDNLLKPQFMDAVRNRRQLLLQERRQSAEQDRLFELNKLKQETMKCNIIAQRIALQEFLLDQKQELNALIENYLSEEDKLKTLQTRERVEEDIFKIWLEGFQLQQPADYFIDHPTDDTDLVCNIQSVQDFFITTLEIFGLPKGYMDKQGHFPDSGKNNKDDKLQAAQKRQRQNKMKGKKGPNKKLAMMMKGKMGNNEAEENKGPPTHFDLEPLQKALSRFFLANGDTRSKFRMDIQQEKQTLEQIFVDEYGEPSFKKCVDINSLGQKLQEHGVSIIKETQEIIGPMMIAFGDIQFDLKEIEKMPEIVPEVKKEEDPENKKPEEEKKQEPPKPIIVHIYDTSIHDLLQAMEKMTDYDHTLHKLEIMKADLQEEERFIKRGGVRDTDAQSDADEAESVISKQDSVHSNKQEFKYSQDNDYETAVHSIEDLETIPDPPEKAKNAFAVTLFCIESAFDSRAKDFLKYAFELYPDRDYLIVTQPHTVPESSLLQRFSLAIKKPENTFSHVLYILHRDSLLDQDLYIRRAIQSDLDGLKVDLLEDKTEVYDDIYDSTVNPDSNFLAFVAKIGDDVIGTFVLSKDVNLMYYKSHFHIQDSILLTEHDRRGHTRLIHSVINPIFEKSTRNILKELLRLTAKSCLYFEIHDQTIIPTIFHELVHLRSRRFPHFLKRKWDHERTAIEEEEENKEDMNGNDRDYLDENESPFALCFTSKRLLSEPKIVKNSRIVIVGASDTGISFIEALLSIGYLDFSNIILIAPGGLPYQNYIDRKQNLKAYSTSYTSEELKRLMLETRVRVINARMVDIDRGDKNVILHDETIIPYDTLILAMGIQDKTLISLGYISRGIVPIPKDKDRVEGLISIDDPYLYQHLRVGGTLMGMLINKKRPQNIILYGRALHTYTCVQGLLNRGMKAQNIIIVIPEKYCHVEDNYDDEQEMLKDLPIINPDAFCDESVENKIHDIFRGLGVEIIQNAKILEIYQDSEKNLESVLFKRLDMPEEEEEDELEGMESDNRSRDEQEESEQDEYEKTIPKKKRKKNELEIECRVMITSGHRDVDPDVFQAIHNNGLVYNGRLIVDKNFQTTDPSIFASGPLCEFSGRYKALSQGKSLRMDRYNGREMGSRLARSVFDIYDPSIASPQESLQDEELPTFFLPQGLGGTLPGDIIYYSIKTTNYLIPSLDYEQTTNRKDLVCDNGHFIKFTFNNIGLIDSVTYMGKEEVVLQSLWAFVGLHENYFNSLTSRFEDGIIPNVSEFLSENWAIALYHEWFGDFCLRLRQGIQQMKDVQVILEKAFDMTKNGEGIDREQFDKLKSMLDPKTRKMIEDETLEFIKIDMDDGLQVYEEFDLESIVLRRSDPDDCDQIINLVEIGKDDVYNRVYSYPKILKLIETAYLSISVLDQQGAVIAFASFEDYPHGMKGQYDDKHYNIWEEWFHQAFEVTEFASMNTLWLTYFISGGPIQHKEQQHAFKKVLQTVYTSLPDITGILFLMRGDADEEDTWYCFEPLKEYFEEVECKHKDVLKNVRGIHYNSKVYFSSRLLVLPFVEVRRALQEDHDDLAAVFNSQSETVTDTYGEYFIAELIAAQNDVSKALVAQVHDKAVGLMGLTSDVDVKLLHQCFELESFDNLLKPEFMDAVRNRRQLLLQERRQSAEQDRLFELNKLKQETMKCNIIAQRIALQEFLIDQKQELNALIENYLTEEDKLKTLQTRERVEQDLFQIWLEGFQLQQPADYFKDHPTDDTDLVCNIQSVQDFFITTLEIFGLPKGYMDKQGHFPDSGKNNKDDKLQAAQKRQRQNKMKGKKGPNKMLAMKMKGKLGANETEENKGPPTHFDLEPLQKALSRFFMANGETRSKFRMDIQQENTTLEQIFVDEYGEPSFKKCVDINTLGAKLQEHGVSIIKETQDIIGPMMIAFGDIQYDLKEIQKMPEIVPEVKKEEDPEAKKPEEEKKPEPPKPIIVHIYDTSIHDLLQAMEKMTDYDHTLKSLDIMRADLSEEERFIKRGGIRDNDAHSDDDEARSVVSEKKSTHSVKKEFKYSQDHEYETAVASIEDLETIPDPPEKAKNAFAVTLFCIESAFDSRARDFLKYSFELYPDRDYLIVTQPHTVPETSLLQRFSLAIKKPENTFSHVLYILHRDSLLDQDLFVRRTLQSDLDAIKNDLLEDKSEIFDDIYDSTLNPDSKYLAFVAKIGSDVIGAFVLSKDVNLMYYKSHFHIQDSILLTEHDRRGHTRLIHSVLNPIFEKSTRNILKELLRLTAKSCLYFEIHDSTVIPTIFNELVHLRSRRFPHFIKKKWDHERTAIEEEEDNKEDMNGNDRDYLDESESSFALCFTSKRLLSEPKIVKNSRIVVVGASDTGISFIEALLSIGYLEFSNIILIAPGGLPYQNYIDRQQNLKAYSTSYTSEELKRLMLETRVRVINARMVDIDRGDKNVILHDETIIPYDTLILAMGIQDKTLISLGYISRGIVPIPKDKDRIEGLISIDDPYLYQHLRVGGTLLGMLINKKRPQNIILYGRALHTYTCVQGLLNRGMKAQNIIIVIPEKYCHVEDNYDDEQEMLKDLPIINPDAFCDESVETKIHDIFKGLGIEIIQNAKIMEIYQDSEKNLESVLFKRLDMPEEEEEDELEGMESDNRSRDEQEESEQDEYEKTIPKKKRKKNELEIECRVMITSGHRDVDPDVFQAIHNNGLVYNGRLIVDKNFQTTDPSIFASGPLCEFSGRYKALSQGKSLRMDRYNGREMGSRLARSVFDIYDPSISSPQESLQDEELPTFFLPQGLGGTLPGNIIYYSIKTTNYLIPSLEYEQTTNRKDLVCDNGHFIKFTFNNIGLIDSVTYMGKEEIVLQSLWAFVGLHENYFNSLTSRQQINLDLKMASSLM